MNEIKRVDQSNHGLPAFVDIIESAKGQSPEWMERTYSLYERMSAAHAEREFNAARHSFQTEVTTCPHNKEANIVSQKKGTRYRYTYADLPQIVRHCAPFLAKHGFSYTFDEASVGGVVECLFILRHTGGHKEITRKRVVGSSTSDPQQDTGAMTTARRLAMSLGLGIVTDSAGNLDPDDAPESEGEPITEHQADNLSAACADVGVNMPGFLQYFQIGKLADLPASRFKEAMDKIEEKRRRSR
jgi:hypothetical protein